MASSFSMNSAKRYEGRKLRVKCTQTKNIAGNYSTISWTLYSEGGEVDWYSTGPTTLKINGTTVYSKSRVDWSSKSFPAAKGSKSGTLKVYHNNDGSKSISVKLTTAIYTTTTTTASDTWTLDKIPRSASITAAPNFNDEANPKITYSNPSGSAVTTLQACISLTGSKDDIAYRDISKTGTSYTFNLTEAERNVLRNATKTANTRTVYFYVKTIVGGNTYHSKLAKTLTIVNATPTISPTVVEANPDVAALTGSSDKLIKYYSDAKFTVNATALKGATISSYSVKCGSKSSTAASGTFTDVDSGTFSFSAKDSRGNTVSKSITKSIVEYIHLTCNLTASNPTADGDMSFRVRGNCFVGSFGAVSNTLTVQYCYSENDGAYTDWIDIDVSPSGSSYSATVNLTGLNYRSKYTFKARAIDKLETANSAARSVRSIPIFDWSYNDFNHNTDVNINGELTIDNKWVFLSIANGFKLYDDNQAAAPKCKRCGSVVTVTGCLSPTAAVTSNATKVTIASGIPDDYCPSYPQYAICQGSDINRWLCCVESDGTVNLSRHGKASYVDLASGNWLPFTITYQI